MYFQHEETLKNMKNLTEIDRMRSLLLDAIEATCVERNSDYGTPSENYGRVRDLWQAYPPAESLDEVDAVVLMILTKVARIVESPNLRDSWLDIAGYAAVGWAVASAEEDKLDEFEKSWQPLEYPWTNKEEGKENRGNEEDKEEGE